MQNDNLLIERYFRDELSPDELVSFNSRLEADQDFNRQFKAEELLFTTLRIAEQKRKYKEQYGQVFETRPTIIIWITNNRAMAYAMAASLALFITIGLYYYTTRDSASSISFIAKVYDLDSQGFGGSETTEKITVSISKGKENQYTFEQTLEITYTDRISSDMISLYVKEDTGEYWIKIKDKLQKLVRDGKTRPLQ